MDGIVWPERPTCHDSDPHAAQFGAVEWHPPRHAETFRTCSYCGSIHPGDLMEMVGRYSVSLEMADWKYGWPHKHYVSGIPNPAAGQDVLYYTYGPRERIAERALPGFEPEPYDDHGRQGWRVATGKGSASATLHAKWYNLHFADLEGDAFAAVAEFVEQRGGVRFEMKRGELSYRTVHL